MTKLPTHTPTCIMDELPDKRIGMSKEDHVSCPACHSKYSPTDIRAIEWNIDPIKRKEVETGEVQIWADVPKETAKEVQLALASYKLLVEVAKEAMAEMGDCSCNGYKCLFCFAQEALARAQGQE